MANTKFKEQEFLADFIATVRQNAERAQKEAMQRQGTDSEGFAIGIVHGNREVLMSLVARLEIYDLDLDECHLADYDGDSIWKPLQENVRRKRERKDTTE